MAVRFGLTAAATALFLAATPVGGAVASPHDHHPGKGKGKPTAGARTLGDPLFPQIGNGGYDVKHYQIYLDYDPDSGLSHFL